MESATQTTRSYVSALGPADPRAHGRALPPSASAPVSRRRETTSGGREDYFPHSFDKHISLTAFYGETAREILGLTPEQWKMMQVKDESGDGRLVQIGYRDDVEPPFELQELRGMVLDTQARIKVCPGSEYTEEIRLAEPTLDIRDFSEEEFADEMRVSPAMRETFVQKGRMPRKLVVHSAILDEDIEFDLETDPTIRNRIYSQGVNIKIFLHNGRVYVITNSNLDPSGEIRNERWRRLWDTDPKFRELFAEQGREHTQQKAAYPQHTTPFTDDFFRILGFKVTDFYPKGCLYSPYTYSFLMTVPHLVTSSRVVFPKGGYLTFIRQEGTWRKLWLQNPELCPFKESEADADGVNTFYMGVPDRAGVNVEEFFAEKKGAQFLDKPHFGNANIEPFLTYPRTNLSVAKSSDYIRYGLVPAGVDADLLDDCLNFDKQRNFLGEAIILTKQITREVTNAITGETSTKNYFYSVQVQPPGFAWRRSFFDKNEFAGDMYKLFVNSLSVYSEATKELNYANLLNYFPAYKIPEFMTSYVLAHEKTGTSPPQDDPLAFFTPEVVILPEKSVVPVMFSVLNKGDRFFPNQYIPPQDPATVSTENYTSVLNVVTPYFVLMMNPQRQSEVPKYYKRYLTQINLLAHYVVDHPAFKSEKGGPYYAVRNGQEFELSALFTFANKCTNYAKTHIPNFLSEAGRAKFLAIVLRLLQRENTERKLAILKQVTLKYGPEKMKEVMEITKVGPGEINIRSLTFGRPVRRRAPVRPKNVNPKTGRREYIRNTNPVVKPGAGRDTALRKKPVSTR